MKKAVRAVIIFLFTAVVAVSIPFYTAAAGNIKNHIFGVSFSVDGIDYTVKCEHQIRKLNSEWYLERPPYLQETDKSDVLYLVLPHDAAAVQLTADVVSKDDIYLDGKKITDGDALFLADGTEHSLSAGGINYRLIVCYGSDIPAVYINTETGSLDNIYANKNNKESAYMTVTDNGKTLYHAELDFIKGRGNFTWADAPKRSFSVKLIEEADLLGMGASKSYALMANHIEMTMLRNKLICDFADAIGIPFSPQAEYVDLYINNEYTGLYALTEKVEVGESRVNIYNLEEETLALNPYYRTSDAKLMGEYGQKAQYKAGTYKWVDIENNPADITGGYIIQMELQERYYEDLCGFVSDYGQIVTLAAPEYASQEQVEYISDYYQQFEDAVISEDGCNSLGRHYSEYIDVESVVRMHILHEFTKNLDAAVTSFYFYKDTDGKLVAAPVWDMDSGFGRYFERDGVNFNSPEELYVSGSRMVGEVLNNKLTVLSLLWRHEEYRQAVFEQWHTEVAPKTGELTESFRKLRDSVEKSRINDRQMWLGGKLTENSVERWVKDSDDFLVDFITRRSEYLSEVYNPDRFRVIYDANGGTNFTVDGALYAKDAQARVQENRFSYDGADFIGWNTEADGSGTVYQPGDVFAVTEDTTLYAQWSLHPVAEQPAEGGIIGLIKRIIRKILG